MFGAKKNDESNTNRKNNIMPTSTSSINSLVDGTSVEGTIRAENDIRVDGKIKGILHCTSKVIIGPSGSIDGEVHCRNAVVEGTFDGILKVKELLNVRESARVTGDIQTDKLIVQSGAVFNVSCIMGKESVKSKTIKTEKATNRIGEEVLSSSKPKV